MKKSLQHFSIIASAIVILASCNKAPAGYSPVTQPWAGIAPFSVSLDTVPVFQPNTITYTQNANPDVENFTMVKLSDTNMVDSTFLSRTLSFTSSGKVGIGSATSFNVTSLGRTMMFIKERKSFTVPYDSTKYTRVAYVSNLPDAEVSVLCTKRDTELIMYFEGQLKRMPNFVGETWLGPDFINLNNGYIKMAL
jgi:aspartate/tyrosine/aromatic aminotransferase